MMVSSSHFNLNSHLSPSFSGLYYQNKAVQARVADWDCNGVDNDARGRCVRVTPLLP